MKITSKQSVHCAFCNERHLASYWLLFNSGLYPACSAIAYDPEILPLLIAEERMSHTQSNLCSVINCDLPAVGFRHLRQSHIDPLARSRDLRTVAFSHCALHADRLSIDEAPSQQLNGEALKALASRLNISLNTLRMYLNASDLTFARWLSGERRPMNGDALLIQTLIALSSELAPSDVPHFHRMMAHGIDAFMIRAVFSALPQPSQANSEVLKPAQVDHPQGGVLGNLGRLLLWIGG